MTESLYDLSDYSGLLEGLRAEVREDEAWHTVVQDVLDAANGARAHLAVMHQPYLGYILDGRKTVESRFSRNQVAPYRQVRRGDLLLFKLLGGPVTAIAVVADVDSYTLDAEVWDLLRTRFTRALAAEDEDFWMDRRDARYATLMRIERTRAIEPVSVGKTDRRGWVVLDNRGSAIHPDQLALTDDTHESPSSASIDRTFVQQDLPDDQIRLDVE